MQNRQDSPNVFHLLFFQKKSVEIKAIKIGINEIIAYCLILLTLNKEVMIKTEIPIQKYTANFLIYVNSLRPILLAAYGLAEKSIKIPTPIKDATANKIFIYGKPPFCKYIIFSSFYKHS